MSWQDGAGWQGEQLLITANTWTANQIFLGTETIVSGTGTAVGLFSVSTDTTATGLVYFSQASADADSFDAIFRKSRGTVGTPTVITTADELGTVQFSGYGGASGYVVGAAIKAISSGTIADTRIPSQLEFWTGTNATPSVLTKRITIDNAGVTTITGTSVITGAAPSLAFTDTTASAKSLTIAVDANLADLRESAGASGSLLTLDLVNNFMGIRTSTPGALLEIKGNNNQLLLTTSSPGYASIYVNNPTVSIGALYWDHLGNAVLESRTASGSLALSAGGTSLNRMYIHNNGNVLVGTTTDSGMGLQVRQASGIGLTGANGQTFATAHKTELTSVASGVLTQATTITIPANAILRSAALRVTVQPGGTATVVATATTSATVLQQGASMSTAANTTDVGTRAWGTNYVGVAAQTITFTFNAPTTDALGRIRVELVYDEPVAPTS